LYEEIKAGAGDAAEVDGGRSSMRIIKRFG
jgi:hypothetical protein